MKLRGLRVASFLLFYSPNRIGQDRDRIQPQVKYKNRIPDILAGCRIRGPCAANLKTLIKGWGNRKTKRRLTALLIKEYFKSQIYSFDLEVAT
jgi:hypothetical protein